MRVIGGQIRQEPGPGNPLGVVKFIFDNPYEVYLHDTNNRSLFDRSHRFLSHGCVRVSNAMELAKQLLKMDPNWPEQRIDEAVESGRNIRIDLMRPISIHVVYDTVWIDDAGIAQFRDDVYGLDRRYLEVRTTGSSAGSSSCGGADH
jgi:murein L,D-transpeptidase YcbB/YkuD